MSDGKPSITRQRLHERLADLLADRTAAELANVVHRLADEWAPADREAWLQKVRAVVEPGSDSDPSTDLATQIERLEQAVQAQAERDEPPDLDDEDGLGPFAELIPVFTQALKGAGEALGQDDAPAACEAYERLFALGEIEDEYGRGLQLEGLEPELVHEHAARYLRAVYLATDPQQRSACVIAAARWLGHLYHGPPIAMAEMNSVDTAALPDWSRFLETVTGQLENARDALGDRWIREALLARGGVDELADHARRQGSMRPSAWIEAAEYASAEADYEGAARIGAQALAVFPRGARALAHLGSIAAPAAQHTGDGALAQRLAFEHFIARPDIPGLIELDRFAEHHDGARQTFAEAARVLETYRGQPPSRGAPSTAWAHLAKPRYAMDQRRMAALAHLLAGNWAKAAAMADEDPVLGWSQLDNAKPIVVAYALAAIGGGDPATLGPVAHRFWRTALPNRSGPPIDSWSGSITGPDDDEPSALQAFDALARRAQSAAPLPTIDHERWLAWCGYWVERRAGRIAERKHRKAYERAAYACAACVEVAQSRGLSHVTQPMVERLRSRYSRHSALQRALTEALTATA